PLVESLGGGQNCYGMMQDVSKAEDAERLAAKCREIFGKVDYIVTAAGLYQHLPLGEIGVNEWRNSLAINLDGVFYTIQA
ncbi:SDR family oxidoreductase, partial [Klebsiella pneumoniae]